MKTDGNVMTDNPLQTANERIRMLEERVNLLTQKFERLERQYRRHLEGHSKPDLRGLW